MFLAVLTTTDASIPDIQRAAGFGILQMTAAGKTQQLLKRVVKNSYQFNIWQHHTLEYDNNYFGSV